MNPLETRRHDAFTPRSFVPLAAQSRGTSSIFVPGQNDEAPSLFDNASRHRNRICSTSGYASSRRLQFPDHQVLNSHIRERPARHDEVIPAPRAVTVESSAEFRAISNIRRQVKSFDCAAGECDRSYGVAKKIPSARAPDDVVDLATSIEKSLKNGGS